MSRKAIDLLTELVSIPSLSQKETEASSFLADWMNRNGADGFMDEAGNAVGHFGSGPKEILLLGHIDTFPGHIPVRQQDGFLFGRGSVDAKGPLCAFAVAGSEVAIPPEWRITVVGAVEEEIATSKGARHIVAQREKQGKRPVCCLIGEPSRWERITLGYKGRLLLELRLKVALAHSSGPEKTPPEIALEIWTLLTNKIESLNVRQQARTHFEMVSPSLRKIQSQDEGCYGVVSLSIGFRLPVWMPPASFKEQIWEWLSPWNPMHGLSEYDHSPAKEHDYPGEQESTHLEVSFSGEEVCWKGGKSNFLVKAFLSVLREFQVQPRFVVKTGTSDMNVVGPAFPDMPILAYGPGDSSLDHTPMERINLNEYLRSIEVLKGILNNLFSSGN